MNSKANQASDWNGKSGGAEDSGELAAAVKSVQREGNLSIFRGEWRQPFHLSSMGVEQGPLN